MADAFFRFIFSVTLLPAKELASDCLLLPTAPLLERGDGASEVSLLGVTTLDPVWLCPPCILYWTLYYFFTAEYTGLLLPYRLILDIGAFVVCYYSAIGSSGFVGVIYEAGLLLLNPLFW